MDIHLTQRLYTAIIKHLVTFSSLEGLYNMKQLLKTSLLLLPCIFLASCASTSKTADTQSSSNDETTVIATTKRPATEQPIDPQYEQAPAAVTPTNQSGIEQYLGISNIDPVKIGEGSFFTKTLMHGLTQSPVEYFYRPDKATVVGKVFFNHIAYHFAFDAKQRSTLRTTSKQYLSDFENHILSSKAKNTYKVYGNMTGEFSWGLFTSGNRVKPKTSIGYEFEKKSPYFTLSYWPEMTEVNNSIEENQAVLSEKITLYFTKKQLAQLIEQFDEAKLNELTIQNSVEVEEGDVY
ncbi:MAG: hypothetical protein K6E51_07825 [Treponema sp.]|nr:hypothetical protein [Treponema sp.]